MLSRSADQIIILNSKLSITDFPKYHVKELNSTGIQNASNYLAKICTNANFISLWGKNNSELIGYLAYYSNTEMHYITMVWVSQRFRKQGFGGELISKFLELNSNESRLEVFPETPEFRIYKSFGYLPFIQEEASKKILMRRCNSVSIMQPYFFPNIQYFQLMHASKIFVFYDDVNFRKGSWINRNLIRLKPHEQTLAYFNVPIENISQNKEIKDTRIANEHRWKIRFLNKISNSYRHSPNYEEIYSQLEQFMKKEYLSIADLAIKSVEFVNNYLNLDVESRLSSVDFSDSKGMPKADRLIHITKKLGFDHYLNSEGGFEIYRKDYFEKFGVKLNFMHDKYSETLYQSQTEKKPFKLSILDNLMNLSKSEVKNQFLDYRLF